MRKKLIPSKEARVRLQAGSMATLYRISHELHLPKYKIRGRLFFAEEDIDAYIESCRIEEKPNLEY